MSSPCDWPSLFLYRGKREGVLEKRPSDAPIIRGPDPPQGPDPRIPLRHGLRRALSKLSFVFKLPH